MLLVSVTAAEVIPQGPHHQTAGLNQAETCQLHQPLVTLENSPWRRTCPFSSGLWKAFFFTDDVSGRLIRKRVGTLHE